MSVKKYLSQAGLARYDRKIKEYIAQYAESDESISDEEIDELLN